VPCICRSSREDLEQKILGDAFDPVQWDCPTVENGLMVGVLTFDNNTARKIVQNMEKLVDISFVSDECKQQFLFVVRKFIAASVNMRLKEEYTDAQIINLQNNIDDFFQVWVKLFSQSRCTNYINFLASGHLSNSMFRWHNLHRFSNRVGKTLTHC
jgi:hypothetical protein